MFRQISTVGYEKVPARGPCVILSTTPLTATLRDLPRHDYQIWQLNVRQIQGEPQLFGKPRFKTFPSLPCWRRRQKPDRLQHLWQEALENGRCLVLLVEQASDLTSVADHLLSIDTATQSQLGISIFCIEAKLSLPLLIRRDLWVRMHEVTKVFRALKLESSPVQIQQAFAQILQETLLLYRGFSILQSYENPDLHDQILLERLARCRSLQLNRDEAVSQGDLSMARRWMAARIQGSPSGRIEALREQVENFWFAIESLDIRDRGLFIHRSGKELKRRLRRHTLKLAFLLPTGLWGIANHYIIYKLPEWWSFWTNRHLPQPQLVRQLALPVLYLGQYLVIDQLFGAVVALVYLMTLPLFGWLGICLFESRPQIQRLAQFLKMMRSESLKNELLNLRWAILELGPEVQPDDPEVGTDATASTVQ